MFHRSFHQRSLVGFRQVQRDDRLTAGFADRYLDSRHQLELIGRAVDLDDFARTHAERFVDEIGGNFVVVRTRRRCQRRQGGDHQKNS